MEPLEPVYCHSTAQRSRPTPGSSSQGDPAQAAGAGTGRGSCGQSAPNFPAGSVNGLSTVGMNGRGCTNPFSTSLAPSPHPLPSGMQPPGPGPVLAQRPWGGLACLSRCQSVQQKENWSRGSAAHPPHPSAPLPWRCQSQGTRFSQSTRSGSCAPRTDPFQTFQGVPSAPSHGSRLVRGTLNNLASGWQRAGGALKEKRCPEMLLPARHW